MASSSRNSVRKKGYVFKLPVSGGVIKVWAKRWAVLHSTTHEGVVRLEYFDTQEAEIRGDNKRVILLRNSTGCIETTEFRSKPFAFQFSTQQGRHVFSVENHVDRESWIDCINDVIREDRMRSKKSSKKNDMAETFVREPGAAGEPMGHAPHVGTLMGVYNIAINATDLSRALNLSGTYSLDVTPKGMSLISTATETEIVKWHFKHIKYYAKSSKNVVTLELGKRSPTGEGKFMFQTTVAKELFSMIHRNIKNIKMARDKKAREDVAKEVERVKQMQKKKEETHTGLRQAHSLRPKSLSYDLDAPDGAPPVPTRRTTLNRHSTIEQITSASTIGTVAEDDMIQLEGFTLDLPDTDDFFDPLQPEFDINHATDFASRNRLSMGATLGEKLELDSLQSLTNAVYANPTAVRKTDDYTEMNVPAQMVTNAPLYANPTAVRKPDDYTEMNVPAQPLYDRPRPVPKKPDEYVEMDLQAQASVNAPIYDNPPPLEGFADSFTSSEPVADPFSNITDPFQSSTRGSFYNAEEDIFQSFDQISSPRKTSTPNPNNPFTQQPITMNTHNSHTVNTLAPQPRPRTSSRPDTKPVVEQPVYSNVSDALKGLKDIQLNTNRPQGPPVPKPRTMKRGATKDQLDDMWGDIAGDFNIPN